MQEEVPNSEANLYFEASMVKAILEADSGPVHYTPAPSDHQHDPGTKKALPHITG